MNLWSKPQNLWQTVLFLIGVVLFWLLLPIWIILCFVYKRNSLFLLVNIQAIFYNPWVLWYE